MNKVTKEGELINNYMQELKVTTQLPTHFPGEDRQGKMSTENELTQLQYLV